MSREIKGKTVNIVFGLVCAVLLICLAVSITVHMRPLYYIDIELLGIAEKSGIPAEICRLNYDALIDYNVIGGPDELEFPTLAMSETGRIHFEEVKNIFIFCQWAGIAGLVLTGTALFFSRERLWMRAAVLSAVGIAAVVLAAVVIDWEWAFETMHGLLFDNDYWIFDYRTDPVIRILPEMFFMHCGIMIIGLVVVMMAGLELIYRKRRRNDGKF